MDLHSQAVIDEELAQARGSGQRRGLLADHGSVTVPDGDNEGDYGYPVSAPPPLRAREVFVYITVFFLLAALPIPHWTHETQLAVCALQVVGDGCPLVSVLLFHFEW